MVICFVPGSGGHRFKRFLTGLPYDTDGGHMHDLTVEPDYLYCDIETDVPAYLVTDIVLTHTMNSNIIAMKFPGHTVTKLKTDYKKSMLREWATVIKESSLDLPMADYVDQMFQMIKWHNEYYNKCPIDYVADRVVDIDLENTKFAQVMRRELDIQDTLFDFAWSTFETYGPDAPIIDLVNASASDLLVKFDTIAKQTYNDLKYDNQK